MKHEEKDKDKKLEVVIKNPDCEKKSKSDQLLREDAAMSVFARDRLNTLETYDY